jgi:hypothetical protein
MTPTTRRLAAVLLAGAVCLASACSSTASSAPGTTQPPATTTTIPGAATPAQTGAATLRANLTALTVANIFLTAVATSATVQGSDPAPAVAAVNVNTAELGTAFGAYYAANVSGQFSALWGQQTPLYVDYARAKLANDAAGATRATDGLAAWRQRLESYLVKTNIYLIVGSAVTPALEPNLSDTVTAMTTLIDAQAAKSPSQYDDVILAAAKPPFLATQLAAANAKKLPDSSPGTAYPGTATGPAANLRAGLTAVFVSHAYLTAVTTATAIGGSDVNPARAALAKNTQALADAFASVYGDASGRQFTDLWNGYNAGFIAYAQAAAASDAAAKTQAVTPINAVPASFAGFISQANPKLTTDAVTTVLTADTAALLAVIDAQAARTTAQFDLARRAGASTVNTAEVLSEGIAEQFPTRYLP